MVEPQHRHYRYVDEDEAEEACHDPAQLHLADDVVKVRLED